MMEVDATMIVAVPMLKWISTKAIYRRTMKLSLMVRPVDYPFNFWFLPLMWIQIYTLICIVLQALIIHHRAYLLALLRTIDVVQARSQVNAGSDSIIYSRKLAKNA